MTDFLPNTDLSVDAEKARLRGVREKIKVLSNGYLDLMEADSKPFGHSPIISKWSMSLPMPNQFFENSGNPERRARLGKVLDTLDPIIPDTSESPEEVFSGKNHQKLMQMSVLLHSEYELPRLGGSMVEWMLQKANEGDLNQLLDMVKEGNLPSCFISEKEVVRQNNQIGMGFDVVSGGSAVESLRRQLFKGENLQTALEKVQQEFKE